MRNKILFFLVFFCIAEVNAQKKINRDHWRETKDGMHYKKAAPGEKEQNFEDWSKDVEDDEKRNSRYLKKRNREFLKEKPDKSSSRKNRSISLNIPPGVMIIVYVLIGVTLLVVIYLLFFKSPTKSNKAVVTIIEEDIAIEKPFDELENLLSEAVRTENYREAIRIYFIFIIKTLREKNWIAWEKKKTNMAYLFEMRDNKHYNAFSQIVLIFEIVWYGKREINRTQYDKLKPQFDALLNSIRTNE